MTNDEKFANWMKSQIHLAGEELIRRADQMNFDGWDAVRELNIVIDIPTYEGFAEMSTIKFSIEAWNKCAIDDILNGGNDYLTESSRVDDDHCVGDILSDVDDKAEN